MPDIDQTLLQFIDVMNLLDPLMHFSHIFCSQSGSDLCCWVAKCLVKWMQLSRFRRLIVPRARWAGTLHCWKIKNPSQISRMTGSSFWVRSTSRWYASLICTLAWTKIRSIPDHAPQLWHTHEHHYRLGELRACLQQTLWCNLSLSCCSQRTDAVSDDFGYGCIIQKW